MLILFLFFTLLSSGGFAAVKNINNHIKASDQWSTTLPQKTFFKTQTELQERVQFWTDIYSKYSTAQGVFHNTDHPSLIYGEIDFSAIQNNFILSDYEKKNRIKKLTEKKRKQLITKFKIKNEKKIRLQMGLRDRMQTALQVSGQYLPMMEKIFKDKNLPPELTRIVFVESSFNIFAQSKVGASGLWQIMPSVGRAEGYVQKYYDKRNHPYYSTVLAADILKKNYAYLKSWPLAITAYNHGLAGVRRMQTKAGPANEISDLINSNKKTNSWGFASENFYACFLAVLQVERNAKLFFGSDLIRSKPAEVKNLNLSVAKNHNEILKIYDGNMNKLRMYNPHLRFSQLKLKKYFPAGTPLVIPVNKTL